MMRAIPALAMCVSLIGCSADTATVRPSDRSWSTGTITLTPTAAGAKLGVSVDAQWPDSVDELWIRYELCLTQTGSPDLFLVGSSNRLTNFQQQGTGVGDYSQSPDFLRHIDRNRSYRDVFDYEIWKGEPAKGELLAKCSVSSRDIGPASAQ